MTTTAMTRDNDGDANRAEVRREILREMFDALSPNATWKTDDRFEHYPLDVQAIVQLSSDQCTERVKLKEVEVTKKLKLQHEKEMRAMTQRHLKDKQAMKLEAEADRRTMGLEVARVKKRFIEAEREKHQATCQTAQTQRDARNLRNRNKEAECRMEELKTQVRQKSKTVQELEHRHAKYKQERENMIQKLKEEILNLEAKLNNQEAYWSEKCSDVLKVLDVFGQYLLQLKCIPWQTAEEKKEKDFREMKTKLRQQYQERICHELSIVDRKISSMLSEQKDEGRSLLSDLRNVIERGCNRTLQIQQKFFEEAAEEVHSTQRTIGQSTSAIHSFLEEKERLSREVLDTNRVLGEYGFTSVQEFVNRDNEMKALLIEADERKKILQDTLDDLRNQIDARNMLETDLKEKMTKLEEEVSQLRDHSEKLADDMRDAQQERDELRERYQFSEEEKQRTDAENIRLRQEHGSVETKRAELETERDQLQSKLTSQNQQSVQELECVRASNQRHFVSLVRNLKERFFDISDAVMEGLKQSMMDVATHSCLRSVKNASQLKTQSTPKKRLNSATHSVLSRTKADLNSLVFSSDLESILSQLRANVTSQADASEEASDGTFEIRKLLMEVECCLFWLLLEARIFREQARECAPASVLSDTSSVMSTRRESFRLSRHQLWTAKRAIERRRSKERGQKEEAVAEGSHFKQIGESQQKHEDEEVMEIIAVLKEYLQNEKSKNHPLSPQL